jgi:phosphatidylserine/phosphatidylglycerophosphate/cardiolipin synthase-like enzyme
MTSIIRKLAFIGVFFIVLAAFASIAYVLYQSQDPETRLTKLLVDDTNTIMKAFFSPDDRLATTLIDLINAEKKRIVVAIYTFTYKDIAQALVDAHHRGVQVEVVADHGYGNDRYSKIPLLANNKIPVWSYQTKSGDRDASLMHNKFCVFEDNILHKAIVWTGSYNFTVRATTRNQENVIVLDNRKIVDQYLEHFEILKTRCLLINGMQGRSEVSEKPSIPLKPLWRELKKILRL